MRKTTMVRTKTAPGLLERNTSNGLSPFIYIAIVVTVSDNSKMKRAATRSRSFFGDGVARVMWRNYSIARVMRHANFSKTVAYYPPVVDEKRIEDDLDTSMHIKFQRE
jgi:hypothetical protein